MKKKTMILISTILMMSIVLACGFSFGETGLSDTEKLQTAVAATIAANQPSQVVPTRSSTDIAANHCPGKYCGCSTHCNTITVQPGTFYFRNYCRWH